MLLDILETLLLAVILFIGINAVSARIRVDGSSMEPNFHNGEFVIVNKLAYKLGKPQRGDVVVFHYPRDTRQEFIKRIIGLPGDEVSIVNGKVYVNGQALSEPYIAGAVTNSSNGVRWTVPAQSLFVLGDNRGSSSDSRSWGAVPMKDVIGKALVVYWPPSAWSIIKHYSLLPGTP